MSLMVRASSQTPCQSLCALLTHQFSFACDFMSVMPAASGLSALQSKLLVLIWVC